MVRPEIHEPLGKTGLGLCDALEARHGVGTKQLLSDRLFDGFWRIALSHRVATSNRAHHVWRAGLRRGGFRRRTAFDLLLLLLGIDRLQRGACGRQRGGLELCHGRLLQLGLQEPAWIGSCTREIRASAAGAEPKTVECNQSGLGVRSDRHGAFLAIFSGALEANAVALHDPSRDLECAGTAWGVSGSPSKIPGTVLT